MSQAPDGDEYPPLSTNECIELNQYVRRNEDESAGRDLAKSLGIPWLMAFLPE